MSTLTLPLSKDEIKKIEALKCILGEKTSAGVIRHMISDYKKLSDENNELRERLNKKDKQYDKLREVARGYFHPMHDLMRKSEFVQK